jgi:ribosomal-protein-alanine N-acetyltransferase
VTAAELAALHAISFTRPRPWSEAEFAAYLREPAVTILEDGHALIVLRTVGGEAEILTLAVHPDRRRQGRARRLLARAEGEARKSGAGLMFLEVAVGNAPARSLYRKLGWTEAGRRKGYFSGEDALVLNKRL